MAIDWAERQVTLEQVLARYYPLLVARAHADAEADWGQPIPFDPKGADAITASIAERAAGMTATQRERIATLVNTYQGDRAALIAAIADEGYSTSHAETIARSEVATAYNRASVLAARQAGLTRVYVSDGESDAACAAVAGTYQSLDWADAHPIQHPRCVRAYYLVNSEE